MCLDLLKETVMPDSLTVFCPDRGDRAEAEPETRAVIDVLAMLHHRVGAMLAEGGPTVEAQLPDLAGQMLQGAAEAWRSVGEGAFEDTERHLAAVAVDAILALIACRRAIRP